MSNRRNPFVIDHEFLQAIPKTDLHCHLDGSLRIDTILDLAEREDIELPTKDPVAMREVVQCGKLCEDLVEARATGSLWSAGGREETMSRLAAGLLDDDASPSDAAVAPAEVVAQAAAGAVQESAGDAV